MNILALFLLFLLVSTGAAAQSNLFDVTSSKYGGKTDSDISEALTMAWKDACASPSMSNVLVPMGTFKLSQQATFEGPCNAPIQFQLQGTVQAPEDRSHLDDSWVHFKAIDKLTLSGGGTFDGQGELFWKHGHGSTPVDIRFKTVNNSIISGISFINSAKFHISVHDSDNITFQQVTIIAPEDSHNTDGIHIASSSRITVSDSYIATGDDCVSIGDGSNQILVSNITCGPGHGISIGSLGKYPDEQPVVGVTVRNCTLTATTNGARIKTWPDSPSASVARDILYEDIIMEDVKNPILINQNYCDKGKTCRLDNPSKVQISDVRFKNIRGSSSSSVAVKLDCSKAKPCLNVELSDIDLMYSGDQKDEITSECNYVKPKITGVTKALACANLGSIPVENPSPPPTSPPPLPAPIQQSPPPPTALEPPTLSPPASEPAPLSPPALELPPLSPPASELPPLSPAATEPLPLSPPATEPLPHSPPASEVPPLSPPSSELPPPSLPSPFSPPPSEPSASPPDPEPPLSPPEFEPPSLPDWWWESPPPPPQETTPPLYLPPSPIVASDDLPPPEPMVYVYPYPLPRPYGPGFGRTSSAAPAANIKEKKPSAKAMGLIISGVVAFFVVIAGVLLYICMKRRER